MRKIAAAVPPPCGVDALARIIGANGGATTSAPSPSRGHPGPDTPDMDFRRYLQSRLPQASDLSQRRFIAWFGHRLHDPNLWHFGRRSVARATGIGFLVAFFPIPIHMVIIVPLAILRGINLPVLIGAVWITNPVTWVPMFYFAYRIGLLFTGAYILKGIRAVLHGPFNLKWRNTNLEIELREVIAIAPLMVLMLVTGVVPNWILTVINASVTRILGG